MAKKKGS